MILTKQNLAIKSVGQARGVEARPSMGKNDTRDICSFYVLPCHTLVIGHRTAFYGYKKLYHKSDEVKPFSTLKANFLLQQHRKLPFV